MAAILSVKLARARAVPKERGMARVAVAVAGGISILACVGAGGAHAAEIRMLVSNAVKASLELLAPEFEKATEHKLVITLGASSELKAEIDKGAAFDVAILTPAAIDALTKDGKATAAGRADIARAPFGLAVRKGAAKPDIGTVEGFKQAMLKANSIAYVEAGAGSPYFKSLLERLRIADQVRPKLKAQPTSNPAAKAVANGEAEVGITAISEILPYAGAKVAGPLPAELQFYSVSTGAVAANSKVCDAARAVIRFLTTPAAAAAFKAKGLEPG
jgi:molybdate transport system substrate-binding protein